MIQNDKWIRGQAPSMIDGFIPLLKRKDSTGRAVISYGLSSYGYDIRLSASDFRIFRHLPGEIVDPKNFNPKFLQQAELVEDGIGGHYFILPHHSYALGCAVEKLKIPPDVTAICLGKSTYARCGVIVNLTPGEAGWEGYLTLEISNSGDSDVRVYAGEGIAQILFLKGEPCETTYEDRKGKYQNQSFGVTLAKV